MKTPLLFSILTALSLLVACNTNSERNTDDIDLNEKEETVTEEKPVQVTDRFEKDGLKIYPAPASPAYENAQLVLNQPPSGSMITGNEINFDFDVSNYELGIQTPDAADKGLANSAKGQHIHLIVDNGPYSAHYEPDFVKSVEDGHHIAIAFLSRSYHESVKNANSYKVFQFTAGQGEDSGLEPKDLTQPMLFYSRPKGEYKGADAQKVLLDFFLVNTAIDASGNSVKLTINNTSFNITQWKPYLVEGMPMGENTITLELVDANGATVGGEMNNVSRTFTLSE